LYLIEEDLVKEIDSLNMKGLYQLNILQDFLYRNGDINDYQNILSQSIISLSDGNGVFKMIQQSPIPDLDSTFLAVRILDQLGLNDHIDITAIANFTEACREDYGFTIAPSDLLKEANIDIEADLKLTYEALWLLDYCDSN
ncbi:MAG: hypothetical protein U9N44_04530, partial [Chloroflexota bacterium]|nr:hypothetical protein [Chloroflexota bacterium]